MSPDIKNGKERTFNIYILKLILITVALTLGISLFASGKNGKEWIIVIDAGHGGKDPGAIGATSYESNITLPVALKTGQYIEQNIKNVKIIYTRKTDTFIEVKERANIANRNNADLFISIHANLTNSKKIQGTETFIMGPAKDQENLEVAMKENEVITLEKDYSVAYQGFDPKSPESYIMFTLMQNIFQEQSTGLASKIQTQYSEKISRVDRGVKQAAFWVLFMTTMPSVLTEVGFISNPSEEKFMNSPQGQDYIASAIFRACRDYINETDSKSVTLDQAMMAADQPKDTPNVVGKNVSEEPIVFMIQVATSANKTELNNKNFKGISEITELESNGRYKYAAGKFSDYSAAVKYRKKLEAQYPDAFVIAVKGNKILPLQQALESLNKK